MQSGVMIMSPVNLCGTLRVRTCSVVWRINVSVVASDASGLSSVGQRHAGAVERRHVGAVARGEHQARVIGRARRVEVDAVRIQEQRLARRERDRGRSHLQRRIARLRVIERFGDALVHAVEIGRVRTAGEDVLRLRLRDVVGGIGARTARYRPQVFDGVRQGRRRRRCSASRCLVCRRRCRADRVRCCASCAADWCGRTRPAPRAGRCATRRTRAF